MKRKMSINKILWLSLGVISTSLAFIGALLPLMPTTVFLLIATYAFARSSPRLHYWLLHHRHFGPLIRDWQEHGAIATKTKYKAIIAIIATFAISLVFGLGLVFLAIQAAILGCVSLFIATRPATAS